MKYLIGAVALLSLSPALFAEESIVPELPTTIVTGDLWESELQNTTASVTVLGEDVLKDNGVQHFEDVINTIPNLTWTGGTSRPRYIQIRGIGENSQFEGETPDSSVRFLIDDLDLTGLGTVGNLFDVQQVEVLRGPQAGAFGANAAGGVIQIVTNDPTPYWTGQTEATVGNDELRAGGIAVGGPLLKNDPEQLTFRLTLHKLVQNGFRENVFLNEDDTNERDELTTRLKLRWIANTDWQFDGQLFYADVDNGFDVFTLNNSRTRTYSDQPGRDAQESFGTSLRASFSGFDAVDITYIAQYNKSNSLYSYDSDWGAGFGTSAPSQSGYSGFLSVEREREMQSNELRFDSTAQENALGFIDRWTLGFYHQEMEEDSQVRYLDFDFFDNAEAVSTYETESYALFAQFDHNFSESTRLILGLRYEHYKVDFSSLTIDNSDLDFDLSPDLLASGRDQTKNNLWGGKLTLEHDLTDAQMLFASITRGYKSGGANTGVFRNATDPSSYADETLWNYEIGLKSEWFEGELVSQVTLFYLDREDAQLRDSAGAGGFFRYFTSNQGDAKNYGMEADATWYFTENWKVSGSLGLLDSTLESTDRELANTPSYTYNARIDYSPSQGFFAGIELVGSDDYYESNSHREKRSSFAVLNGSVGYRLNNWTFTLWGKNLLDEAYEDRVFYFDNFNPVDLFVPTNRRYEAPAAPRTFGVTLNYTW